MNIKAVLLTTILIIPGLVSAEVRFEPVSASIDVSFETITENETNYDLLRIIGFDQQMNEGTNPGLPAVPFKNMTFLLPPGKRIAAIDVLSTAWDTLPGSYCLYPAQAGILSDTSFTPPDSAVYSSSEPFPSSPLFVTGQGSAMGYSVATIGGTPVRYIPADSTVMILTSVTINIRMEPTESDLIVPERETEWSSAMRQRGILSLVSNPEDLNFYTPPMTVSFRNRNTPLSVTESPSSDGDCVDMVIITSEELADDFERLADYRTSQGIVTVVRTTEWINQYYSGCDCPEKIRNFIRDAHQEWGIQSVLLGGDDGIVPVRQCNGWKYLPGPFPLYQSPSDNYYADIDGNWSLKDYLWSKPQEGYYIDLCTGRWPVNGSDDFNLLFAKLQLYESPEEFPGNFARRLLLMGSNIPEGNGADDLLLLVEQLENSAAIPEYLDAPEELYYPHSLPGGDLCRNTALEELNQGYNIIIHADHSEIHKLAAAGKNALGEYMWDSDFATVTNFGEPSILWSLGCDPGHFDGARCIAEAGLLTSDSTGLIAAIVNARVGIFSQKENYYALCDALFNTGWLAEQSASHSSHWPLSCLGEIYRCSMNFCNVAYVDLNFLGSPAMFVWRDDPRSLHLTAPWTILKEGESRDITVTVTDGTDPVENATVCIWKKDEIFSTGNTDAQGHVTFENVCVTNSEENQELTLTAVKRRTEIDPDSSTVANFVPAILTLDIYPADIPIVSLESFTADAAGDGTANPGETVDILITAANSGGEPARNISAQLSVVSGAEYVSGINDDHAFLPDIREDQTACSSDPFTVTLNPEIESYSTIEFRILFTCEGGSGLYRWKSPLYLTVYSEAYSLTVLDCSAEIAEKSTTEIALSNLLLANCGLGEGRNLNITIGNLEPMANFDVDTLYCPAIGAGAAAELEGSISMTVMPGMPGSEPWLEKGFPGCSFDVMACSDGGSFATRNVDLNQTFNLQQYDLSPPSDLTSCETGHDYIRLHWDHEGEVSAEGFYIYCGNGEVQYLVYPLPVPVNQITIEDLEPGTVYDIEVTAVDSIGRESEPAAVSVSTSYPAVSGWPVQLAGSPGGGPLVADVDQDGIQEIIAATSFGVLYIIERDGSCQALYPPAGYDFDRFLGCAAGDIDGDSQLEIVVSCQNRIEVENSEKVAILLFDRSGPVWTVEEIAATNVNEQAASPNVAGTPVLFQADSNAWLEIALRTRGNNGGSPHLYAWRYDPESGTWINWNDEFPVTLVGCCYGAPSAVDFDGDGFEELIVTNYGSGGTGTALTIADFDNDGEVTVTKHDLTELDTEGETARVFGTLASAEENGTYYLTGAAKSDILCSSLKRVFVYELQTDPVGVSLAWKTGWLTGEDFYSNMPGPAIGNIDSDLDLEVIYTLNSGEYSKEGIILGWDLSDGTRDFRSDDIPFNPLTGEGGGYVKSQPVTGLTTSYGSDGMAVFAGFSTLHCGFDPQSGPSILDGFPAWSLEGSWSSPAICDLDNDGYAEVLTIDYSGYATLFSLDQYMYSADGWHMYQDNSHRNGFYNTVSGSGSLDISISESRCITSGQLDSAGGCSSILAEIEVSACGIPCAGLQSEPEDVSISELSQTLNGISSVVTADVPNEYRDNHADSSSPFRTAEIAAFCGGILIGSATTRLQEGSAIVEIPVRTGNLQYDCITVIADPFNEYLEADENNNVFIAENTFIAGNSAEISIPSPAETLELSLTIPHAIPDGLSIRVYSIDGRLVSRFDTEELQPGSANISLNGGSGLDRLPAGMYSVCISGLYPEEIHRNVIILGTD